jgi:hypothetical protein
MEFVENVATVLLVMQHTEIGAYKTLVILTFDKFILQDILGDILDM